MLIRAATRDDLPRIREVRHGCAENPLDDPSLVTDEEVAWYLDEGIFLVAEDEDGVQAFACANPLTAYVWALFVIDGRQRRGLGSALLDAATSRLRDAGHRQAYLHTGDGLSAEKFYSAQGWVRMGCALDGEIVYRLWL